MIEYKYSILTLQLLYINILDIGAVKQRRSRGESDSTVDRASTSSASSKSFCIINPVWGGGGGDEEGWGRERGEDSMIGS